MRGPPLGGDGGRRTYHGVIPLRDGTASKYRPLLQYFISQVQGEAAMEVYTDGRSHALAEVPEQARRVEAELSSP